MTTRHWIPATEAVGLLSVSRRTLYAYVSRGLIRSQVAPDSSRRRLYSRDDVVRVRRRAEGRRRPETVAAHALDWGAPVLESSLSLIEGGRLYYRGLDAVLLSGTRTVADVASLMWSGHFDDATVRTARRAAWAPPRGARGRTLFVTRAQAALASAAMQDSRADDLRPEAVIRSGWSILRILAATATSSPVTGDSIDAALGHAWDLNARGTALLRKALILCTDHELNVSAFTARCVASAGANPYGVVIAALAALGGPRHGGVGAHVESMLESARQASSVSATLRERFDAGDALWGFGHPLYPTGDPRAVAILDELRAGYGRSPEPAFILEVTDAGSAITGQQPNLDFALAALTRVLRLPRGAGLMLFAIGRVIGWIGHAIEQYATDQLIRPRARYVGVTPAVGAQP